MAVGLAYWGSRVNHFEKDHSIMKEPYSKVKNGPGVGLRPRVSDKLNSSNQGNMLRSFGNS